MIVLLNSAAIKWLRLDQLILDYISRSLSDARLSQVINCETSYDAWEVLETLYGRQTRDPVQQMCGELQALTKGSSSMKEYLHKAKLFGCVFAAPKSLWIMMNSSYAYFLDWDQNLIPSFLP